MVHRFKVEIEEALFTGYTVFSTAVRAFTSTI
jgi:hypothetical protein